MVTRKSNSRLCNICNITYYVFLLKDAAKLLILADYYKYLGYSASICDEWADTKGNEDCFKMRLKLGISGQPLGYKRTAV